KGQPVFMFKERNYSYSVVRTIGDDDYDERKLVGKNVMPGNWYDILVNVKWSKKKDGFFKVWVNTSFRQQCPGRARRGGGQGRRCDRREVPASPEGQEELSHGACCVGKEKNVPPVSRRDVSDRSMRGRRARFES
ncbi:MAG: hypothetical protein VYB51_04040, partial [Gemmatimonadota bacterium]|nr:hypothetical protein [Gemmatimonadota bacterium]